MADWRLVEEKYNKNQVAHLGNKFLVGNGYMGVRGTLEEHKKTELAAINLAGIYDKVGSAWREPLNAPNAFYGYLIVDGKVYSVTENEPKEHKIELDYRNAVFKRTTSWQTDRGNICFSSERFVSMDNVHLGISRVAVRADFHADVELRLGVDAAVWDINGPHYSLINDESTDSAIAVRAITNEKQYEVFVNESVRSKFPCEEKSVMTNAKHMKSLSFVTDINKEYIVDRFFSIYTSKDCVDFEKRARADVSDALDVGYERLLEQHTKKWAEIWDISEVKIEGYDDSIKEAEDSMEALNYSIYHLNCIAPRHADNLSIAARGLSGQTYKGAVFWDTEMFMMDYFLMTDTSVAKKLIKYRIDTLPGAKEKAKSYGYEGAFYPWEGQEGGYDACSDYNVTDVFTGRPMRTYFKDKQVHISAAIVYAINRYMLLTGDNSILEEGGAETVIECAKFYYSMLVKKVSKRYYEIQDVIGPDEYHERVNNNGYTNRMAKFTFEIACNIIKNRYGISDKIYNEISEKFDFTELKVKLEDAYKNILIPTSNEDGIIPQFDGYLDLEDTSLEEVRGRILNEREYWGGAYGVATHTQIIKQADVITWMCMFPEDFSKEQEFVNWEYYEPRTEHGSSLSACMYALSACRCDMTDKAYPLFMKSARADLAPGGKEWAGLIYIGGTHPASEGGTYMVAVRGFAGIYFEDDMVKAEPHLPSCWKKMKFKIKYHNNIYEIEIEDNNAKIVRL